MLGVSIMAYQYNADIWNHTLDFLFNIPVNVLLSFALFGTLGYLFYTFIYGAMGLSYTDGKEKKVKECYNQADNTEADLQTEITATLKYFAAHAG